MVVLLILVVLVLALGAGAVSGRTPDTRHPDFGLGHLAARRRPGA